MPLPSACILYSQTYGYGLLVWRRPLLLVACSKLAMSLPLRCAYCHCRIR